MRHDQFKAAILQDYELFSAAILAGYLSITSAAGPNVQPAMIQSFTRNAARFVSRFVQSADTRIDEYVAQVAPGVDTDARSVTMKQSLRVIVIRNSHDLQGRLRGSQNGLKNLFGRNMGALGHLMQATLAKPELKSQDGSGRMWDSDKLLGVLARDFAYQTMIDAQAADLAARGHELVRVAYPVEDDPRNELIMSLTGAEPDFPSFAAVRAKHFHPNSSAELTHV